MKQSGFTLVEMIMVILLIGILSAVAIPNFIDFGKAAKISVTQNRLVEIKQAIIGDPRAIANGTYIQAGFENHVGSLPSSLNDLVAQGAYPAFDPFTKRGWRGPYLSTTDSTWNVDKWGVAIVYNSATRTLRSCGPDKTCGNSDDLVVNF